MPGAAAFNSNESTDPCFPPVSLIFFTHLRRRTGAVFLKQVERKASGTANDTKLKNGVITGGLMLT